MRILIGYSMRSGSTLLQHILAQHSAVRSCSDVSSLPALAAAWLGLGKTGHRLIKPVDLLYLLPGNGQLKGFDRYVWLVRDPRDSYLSAVESGYAYLFWPRGRKEQGIDVGLVKRWQRIARRYLASPDTWHLVRYEDLVQDPDGTLTALLDYIALPPQQLLPFSRFNLFNGGDYKLRSTATVKTSSLYRHTQQLSPKQQDVFRRYLAPELEAFGYTPGPGEAAEKAFFPPATKSPSFWGECVTSVSYCGSGSR